MECGTRPRAAWCRYHGLAAVTGVRLAPPQGPTGSDPEGRGQYQRARWPWARLGKYLMISQPLTSGWLSGPSKAPWKKVASGLNQLKCRVEAFHLDAGIGGCKAPVSFDIVSVAVEEPGGNLALEAAPIRDTPIEALIGQDSELRLGHIEPAAVLGGVVPFE